MMWAVFLCKFVLTQNKEIKFYSMLTKRNKLQMWGSFLDNSPIYWTRFPYTIAPPSTLDSSLEC